MLFHEVRFPPGLSLGATGGPQRRTDVVTLANGFEERNTPWAHSRRVYDAGVAMRSIDDLRDVLGFFEARRGQLHGFRWKDWADYKTSPSGMDPTFDNETIGFGDGIKVTYQLTRSYRSGPYSYARPIRKPVAGTVRVGLEQDALTEGVDYEVDVTTGLVTFGHPPDPEIEIRAGFEFDVPVRFDTDRILASVASFNAGAVPDVPVIEVRV
jgi:uncharacterized protein (TIGR02217 family)